MKKKLTTVLAIVLVVALSVAGTYAYLTDKTATIKNTFTVGNVNIDLTETWNTDTNNDGKADAWKMQLIPGTSAVKDPTVTVKANSEKCYLFVKLEKSSNFDSFMTYEMADGWTALTGNDGVFYREVAAATTDTDFAVLKNNQVKVLDTVTKEMLTGQGFTAPTLTFTAYAVQKDNIADAATAWRKLPANP